MQKKSIVLVLMAAVIMVWSTMVTAEQELCIPMGSIDIDPPETITQERASVDFPHSKHFKGYSCDRCHHTWNGDEPVRNCMTSGCHDTITPPANPLKNGKYTADSIKYYKYAYHNQCRDCHKELKNQKTKTVKSMTLPTGCIECHPKH